MKTLAFEFSTEQRSVAVWVPGAAGKGERSAEARHRLSRSTPVFALVERALAEAGVARTEIEVIVVGLGPGSSTGIRTALAIAQGWLMGRAVKVVGRSSLVALAAHLQTTGQRGEVHLAVDAQRREYHLAKFRLSEGGWEELTPLRLVPSQAIQELLEAGQRVWGPGLAATFPEAGDEYPTAGALARLAEGSGGFPAAESLEPIHLRQPDFVKAPPPSCGL